VYQLVTRSYSVWFAAKANYPSESNRQWANLSPSSLRRPFEPDESITRRILVTGKNLRDFADLSDPTAILKRPFPPEEPEVSGLDMTPPLKNYCFF